MDCKARTYHLNTKLGEGLMSQFDAVVIGAGFAGATVSRALAEAGRRVLLVERRDHIGGNAYDCIDDAGGLVHKYGPHIFHTKDKRVYDFLSRFTAWRDYQHRVVANVHGQLMPVPFNLTSLDIAFEDRAAAFSKKLLDAYGEGTKVTILDLRRSDDPELAELADYVYENIFKTYTMKQWGQKPEDIDPGTTARVPVFLSRDDRYFQDPYQGMPRDGYTSLFEAMLDHPNIELRLSTDAASILTLTQVGTTLVEGEVFTGPIVYTGAVDDLFDRKFGRLPYRTLDFVFETHPVEWYQTHGTVNYTVDQDYTRITEFKHLTGQELSKKTTIVKEYSKEYTGEEDQTPYYAIINDENKALYQRYADLAGAYGNLHLLGRLAEYQYYNMDAIVARGLELADRLKNETEKG